MALSIEKALERLLESVKAAGRADATINLYRFTLKSLIKECGYSMNDPCDQNTVDNLFEKVEEKNAEETIVFEVYVDSGKTATRIRNICNLIPAFLQMP